MLVFSNPGENLSEQQWWKEVLAKISDQGGIYQEQEIW